MAGKIFGVFGIALITISLPFVVMAVHDLITGQSKTERGVLFGLVVMFGALSFWGFKLASSGFGWKIGILRVPRIQVRSARDKEQAVLALAAVSVEGRVTLVEVAGKCDLTIEEAENILNDLAARRAVELLIAEDGTVVYDFDILTRREKENAKELR